MYVLYVCMYVAYERTLSILIIVYTDNEPIFLLSQRNRGLILLVKDASGSVVLGGGDAIGDVPGGSSDVPGGSSDVPATHVPAPSLNGFGRPPQDIECPVQQDGAVIGPDVPANPGSGGFDKYGSGLLDDFFAEDALLLNTSNVPAGLSGTCSDISSNTSNSPSGLPICTAGFELGLIFSDDGDFDVQGAVERRNEKQLEAQIALKDAKIALKDAKIAGMKEELERLRTYVAQRMGVLYL